MRQDIEQFGIDNQFVAGVISYLVLIKIGDKLETSVGSIIKTTETEFKIVVDEETISKGIESVSSTDITNSIF